MKFLSAPWRWEFITKIGKQKDCLFCQAQKENTDDTLVCFRGKHFFIILNKYPYSTGHLMIVPYRHVASPDKISAGDSMEMWELLNKSIEVLTRNLHPDGYNIGMNIGKAAGAGVKDHCHLHVVPRWSGDANFMSVLGETKVMSYRIDDIRTILKRELAT
jgi:ATP adenylyltransferase